MKEEEHDCYFDPVTGELVPGPHLTNRLNPQFSNARGFCQIHGLFKQADGSNHFGLKLVVYRTGCKDDGLILNHCPFCGALIRKTESTEED